VGTTANNLLIGPGAPPTNIGAFYVPASALPTVFTDTAEARITGSYQVRPGQSLRLEYAFQHMSSDDWMYEGMQIGAGTLVNVLPSDEQPFAYGVHALSINYVVTF
jgi:hypothetical protein